METGTRLRNIKVGIAAVGAFIMLGFSYWFIGALRVSSKGYSIQALFSDVRGIDRGAPVMMAGVKIGAVSDIKLTEANRALVELRIGEKYAIPLHSVVRIASLTLLGDRYIEVVPGKPGRGNVRPGKTLVGIPAFSLDDLLPQVSQVLDRMDKVGATVQELVQDQGLRDSIRSTVRNLDMASAAALALVNQVRGMAGQNRDEIDAISSNMVTATGKMASASNRIDSLLSGTTREDVKSVMQDVSTILSELKAASADLKVASGNAAKMSSDPDMQADIKASIRNAREATEGAKAVVGRVSELVGVGKPAPKPRPAPLAPPGGVGGRLDTIVDVDRGKLRVDANYVLQLSGRTFYRGGVYDLGENARVNLQVGRVVSPDQAFRWGLYQSRLGLGYDWQTSRRWMLQGDLYHPNEPRVDLRARMDLNKDLGGWLGMEDLGGRNAPVVGVQFKF